MKQAMTDWINDTVERNKKEQVRVLRPAQDFVLVRCLKDSEMTAGGIVIPETAADPLFACQQATVVAMSEKAKKLLGVSLEEKYNMYFENVTIGATVIVPKFGGTTVKANGGEIKLFKAIEILAVIY